MVVSVLFGILTMTAYILYLIWRMKTRVCEPPSFSGYIPILGHLHYLLGGSDRIIQFIKRGAEESYQRGYALTFWMSHIPIYVLSDPDDCFSVASTCFETPFSFGKEIFGDSLLTSSVSTWKRHRKLINPTFNQQTLNSFMPIFNKQARRLVHELRAEVGKGRVDSLLYIKRNTLETICLTAMGVDISGYTKLDCMYIASLDNILKHFMERFIKIWMRFDFIYKHSELKKRLDRQLDAFHNMSATVLERKKEELKWCPAPTAGFNQKSFIDMLIQDGVFTDEEIKDEVNLFITTGHETIATLLMMIFALIGSFPDVQEKMVTEFRQVLYDGDGEDVTRQQISRLQYLEAVIKETMRYYSIVPLLYRVLDRDIRIKNYTLRSGNICTLSLHGIHHHPMWGADAKEFKPERWLDSAKLPENPNAFTAFGLGKRNCIGRNFAMMSVKTLLVHVLQEYTIRSDHSDLKLTISVILRPISGYISLEQRK